MRRVLAMALGLACAAAHAGALRIVSWNTEWLADLQRLEAASFWQRCAADPAASHPGPGLPPCDALAAWPDARAYRTTKLAALRKRLQALAAEGLDVLAVQEVQDAAALQEVLPRGFRVACTTRGRGAQQLAFAVREGLQAACEEPAGLDLASDAEPHALRNGLLLTLGRGPRRIELLNVHLKSGCARGRMDGAAGPACATLQRQAGLLQQWLAGRDAPLVLLGDFNRRDASQLVEGLAFAEVDRSSAAHGACRRDLDHVGGRGVALRQARLLPATPGVSDHCPLSAELEI